MIYDQIPLIVMPNTCHRSSSGLVFDVLSVLPLKIRLDSCYKIVMTNYLYVTEALRVHSYVDLPGYSAMMGTLFRDPKEGEPGVQTIPLTKIVCGPSESQLVMLQLE